MNRQAGLSLVIAALLIVGVYTYVNTRTPAPAASPVAAPATRPAPARDSSAPAARPAPDASAPVRPSVPAASPAPADVVAAPPAVPTTATLRITSDVEGAQVFIDRKFIGTAPVTAEDVAPGTRQINVSAPGHEGVAETLEVAPGSRDVMISLKTIRLDESVAVIHKHRVGSCSGRLIATPGALRYETDNKDDGFMVPLPALEPLTTDFAAKSLKVKIRGGRTYDFVDAAGQPEPLYFFHQAVEKVRKRLAGSGK